MSAIALDLLQQLRESGVADERAIKIAESFDRQVKEAMREAKAYSDRNRRESEEKAAVKFVSKDEYAARDKTLATRGDMAELRTELRADMADIRKDIRVLYNIVIVGLATLVGGSLAIIGGVAALIVKVFFGV